MSGRQVLRLPDTQFVEAVTGALAARIVERQAATGIMRLLLTGGRTSRKVVSMLAASPSRAAIDWSALEIWWSDERYLVPGDPERNDVYVGDLLRGDSWKPARARQHCVPGPDSCRSPEEAAQRYSELLPGKGCSWDVALLSLGEDGHIASIFPESPTLHTTSQVTAVHSSPKPPVTRVTLSLGAINAADEVWVMASGSEKAGALRLTLDSAAGPLQMPAGGLRGRSRTVWFVDDSAAARLPAALGRRN